MSGTGSTSGTDPFHVSSDVLRDDHDRTLPISALSPAKEAETTLPSLSVTENERLLLTLGSSTAKRARLSNAPWRVRPPTELRGQVPLAHHWKDHIRAAFIALFHEDRLLLVQGLRSGLWQLPGGLVDQTDESIWDCATREFYEETGSIAPLPPVRLQGWFETAIDWGRGTFHGAILVLKTEAASVPFAANDEMRASAWVPWSKLHELDYRWPNDETIPLIYDRAQRTNCPARVKPGGWSETRPVLTASAGQRERNGCVGERL